VCLSVCVERKRFLNGLINRLNTIKKVSEVEYMSA
jgi:hypothetical protein